MQISIDNNEPKKVTVSFQDIEPRESFTFERNGTGDVNTDGLNKVLKDAQVDKITRKLQRLIQPSDLTGNNSSPFSVVGGYSGGSTSYKSSNSADTSDTRDKELSAGLSKFFFIKKGKLNKQFQLTGVEILEAFVVAGHEGIVFIHTRENEPIYMSLEDFAKEIENKKSNDLVGATKKYKKQDHAMDEGLALNTILYGPPGTGKTYSLTNKVCSILGLDSSEYKSLGKVLEEKPDQVDFITFHQSYSYEDFIEGITAETDAAGNIKYVVRNGIFKVLCRRAYLDKCRAQLDLNISDEEIENYAVCQDSASTCQKIDERIADATAKDNPTEPQKYVICIDEINRGNISKIFGELITLIEDSKRYGGDDYLYAKLLYSKDKLIVPDNLYIIGTMNTADRSIAKLDVALRRRFDFTPMYPEVELLSENLRPLLSKLNSGIRERKQTDEFAIGHAFFIGVEDNDALYRTLRKKVVPLLEEYFLENREEVSNVLTEASGQQINYRNETFTYQGLDHIKPF